MTKPITALIILDGFGFREEKKYNAIRTDGAAHVEKLWAAYPHTTIQASGMDVGLPRGQMGNSEVGHLNIGAGRVVMQDLPRINLAIEDGSIAQALEATGLVAALKASGGAMAMTCPGMYLFQCWPFSSVVPAGGSTCAMQNGPISALAGSTVPTPASASRQTCGFSS